MYIYIIMLVVSLVFIHLYGKTNNNKLKYVFAILSVMPFFLISALRYDVGTDYLYRYVHDFKEMINGVEISNLEIGFKLLMKLCIAITHEYQLLFIIISIIILSLVMYTIYKNSKSIWLSVTIFFLAGFFFQSLNIMRQYIAISIVMFSAINFFAKEKNIQFVIGVILACFIHNSAIICLVMLLIKKKNYINPIVLTVFGVIIFAFGGILMDLFRNIVLNTRFASYINSEYDRGEMRILTLLVNLIIYMLLYAFYIVKNKNNKLDEKDKFYLNLQGLTLIFVMLSSRFFLFFRIAYFFMIYQILSIPHFIKTTDINEFVDFYIGGINKILKTNLKLNDKVRNIFGKLIPIGVVCFFSVIIFYTNVLNNDEEVIPYKTIFQREQY